MPPSCRHLLTARRSTVTYYWLNTLQIVKLGAPFLCVALFTFRRLPCRLPCIVMAFKMVCELMVLAQSMFSGVFIIHGSIGERGNGERGKVMRGSRKHTKLGECRELEFPVYLRSPVLMLKLNMLIESES